MPVKAYSRNSWPTWVIKRRVHAVQGRIQAIERRVWAGGMRLAMSGKTMNARLLTTLALPIALAITACCGAEEQHAINFSNGPDLLTVTRNGVTRKIGMPTRATAPPISPPNFQFVFNTLEGSTIGDGIALSTGGNDPVTDELIIVALALPMSLRVGDVYTVGATYSVQPGVENDPGVFGAYDLQQPNQAEASFTVATYTFPPGEYNANFRAVSTTGTVRVTERERGRVALSLNLTFTDAAGNTATVTGVMTASNERYTPPCYS